MPFERSGRCLDRLLQSLLICLFVLGHLQLVDAMETVAYEFGKNCTSSPSSDRHYRGIVNENRQLDITYEGKTVNDYCATISFKGVGDGPSVRDEYKVCVTPVHFNDPSCAVQLNFTENASLDVFKSIDCVNYNVSKFCGGQKNLVFMELKVLNESEVSRANFKLLVTAEKVYTYEDSSVADSVVYYVVGAVIGVIIVVSFFGIRKFLASRRKKRMQMQNQGN